MKTNTIIKQQARQMLKGNRVPIISGFIIVILALMAVVYTQNTLLYAFDQIDENGMPYENFNITMLAVAAGSAFVLALLSPLLNGSVRLCANLTRNGTVSTGEMFYYFQSFALYAKTVLLNFVIFWFYTILSTLLSPYHYASALMNVRLEDTNPGEPQWWILTALFVVSVAFGIVIYTVVVQFPLLVYAFEPQRGVVGSTFALWPFFFRNLGNMLSLMCSFLGWLLLCFFVVPALYVVPYYTVASADAVKWMLRAQNP